VRRGNPSAPFSLAYNLLMPTFGGARKQPELQIRCDVNSIPVSAKCSSCGESMPQSESRLEPMDKVGWFTAQFEEHKALKHPPAPPKQFGSMSQGH